MADYKIIEWQPSNLWSSSSETISLNTLSNHFGIFDVLCCGTYWCVHKRLLQKIWNSRDNRTKRKFEKRFIGIVCVLKFCLLGFSAKRWINSSKVKSKLFNFPLHVILCWCEMLWDYARDLRQIFTLMTWDRVLTFQRFAICEMIWRGWKTEVKLNSKTTND